MALSKLVRGHFRWFLLAAGLLALPTLSNRAASSARQTLTDARTGIELNAILAAYGAEAVSIDRGARDFKSLDQISWTSRAGSTSQSANIFGDPTKPGLYVQLLKRGPDDWSQPHAHPNDRYITVIAGTMKIGTGAKFDKENTVSLGPGSFIKDVAGQMHYDGTGPEGLTIEIIGMGPTGRIQ